MIGQKMNQVFQGERETASFKVQEVTDLFNGGHEKTVLKQKIYDLIYKEDAFKLDDFYFLSREERMKRVHEKCYHLQKFFLKHKIEPNTDEFWFCFSAINDDLPLLIHYFLFLPTLYGQADEEQIKIWGPLAKNCEIIGCYAQTEIGHGSNVRGIETIAVFKKETDEFELHSPTLTSTKCWFIYLF
jgi:acyl-CoA oxidase